MAEETTTAAAPKKAAPKRKAPAKAKVAAKRKPAAKRKAPAKSKPAAKATAKLEKATAEFTSKAKESSRSALLVGLGCYGMAYDQVQEQLDTLQGRLDSRKKQADKLYKQLVKRGEKVEKEAKKAMDDIQLPKLDLEKIADRKKLEAGLDKAKARFEELKSTATAKFAA